MSKTELIQRAQQGDAEAIAQLLHLSLYTRGIRIKTHRTPTCLQILLEAHRFPERHHLVEFIHRGIAQLHVTAFKSVEIYARQPDTTQFLWCDGFDVKASASTRAQTSAGSPLSRTLENSDAAQVERASSVASPQLIPHWDDDIPSLRDNAAPVLDAPDARGPEKYPEESSVTHMTPTAIARQAQARMAAQQDAQRAARMNAHPRRNNDLGWMLVEKFKRFNPFATGLAIILTLHSIFGSRHYTPEGFIAARDPMMMYLHNINLIIHEAGHPIFGIFGEFLGLLGGSLMQVLVPGVIAGYFFLTRQRFALAIALWWTGQSILDVSFYIKDAQERAIPLLGGEAVMHDWHFLLLKLRLLPYDDEIAGIVFCLGILLYLVAIPLGFYYAYTKPKNRPDLSTPSGDRSV